MAFSPKEFAELFGKSQTWGYRQIYAGKVKAITEHGRFLIPAAEGEMILQKAGIYDGLKLKPAKTKEEIQNLTPRLKNAWQLFLAARRETAVPKKTEIQIAPSKVAWPSSASGRQAALDRLTRRDKGAKDR